MSKKDDDEVKNRKTQASQYLKQEKGLVEERPKPKWYWYVILVAGIAMVVLSVVLR